MAYSISKATQVWDVMLVITTKHRKKTNPPVILIHMTMFQEICGRSALWSEAKTLFPFASTGIILSTTHLVSFPWFFLSLLQFLSRLSFTCKCLLPPHSPSSRYQSRWKGGDKRLHPISVEWCHTCVEMHITLKCSKPTVSASASLCSPSEP